MRAPRQDTSHLYCSFFLSCSYFNVLAHDPPHVAIGFCHTALREHGKKDSLYNILETR